MKLLFLKTKIFAIISKLRQRVSILQDVVLPTLCLRSMWLIGQSRANNRSFYVKTEIVG